MTAPTISSLLAKSREHQRQRDEQRRQQHAKRLQDRERALAKAAVDELDRVLGVRSIENDWLVVEHDAQGLPQQTRAVVDGMPIRFVNTGDPRDARLALELDCPLHEGQATTVVKRMGVLGDLADAVDTVTTVAAMLGDGAISTPADLQRAGVHPCQLCIEADEIPHPPAPIDGDQILGELVEISASPAAEQLADALQRLVDERIHDRMIEQNRAALEAETL